MKTSAHFSRWVRCAIELPLLTILASQAGCGPQDYQKPIQQFQDASAIVISTTRIFLNNENSIEQDERLDEVVFALAPLDLPAIAKIQLISVADIKLRTDALDALAKYTASLATLAEGKEGADIGTNTKTLSDNLKALAADAGKTSTSLSNAQFSGLASAAASALGSVAQLIVEHRARREIEQAVVENDKAATALMALIGSDLTLSYNRQASQLGAYGDQLKRDYDLELKGRPDPVLMLSLARTVKTYRTKASVLASANPEPVVKKMVTAHEALVAYVKSDKTPTNLSQLFTAAQGFVDAAQSLGQAVQALVVAS